ncbi:PfkB family carbohydrate kinase [Pyrobaculum sp. 3827-6]|uniref:PfkB family carbohydrate kinase n=1 Tax=Pyrobaculum sp. 3827-6 TaxID=2983604 RepID=UPI0021DAA9FA|nr:PfkB family carbohydrate kinase [Pyrobaculum sp. 3827-6]MCU7787195.1 PfkB family carbohydrate kinase [Pyrobaculum sp. 3827-6]
MEITVAGNPTVDIIITDRGVARRLGGPIYYASLVFGALGARARAVGVASSDLLGEIEQLLRSLGVEPQLEAADVTTTFELDYRTKPRKVRLVAKPSRGIASVSGGVVILSPVYDELAGTEVKGGKIVVDLQGYIRSGTPPPRADLVHLSHDDMQIATEELVKMGERWPVVVYTLGDEGAYIVERGVLYYINSARLEISDVTGSGDVFLAALTYYHYVKNLGVVEAACEASKIVAGFLSTRKIVKYDFECVKRVVQRWRF